MTSSTCFVSADICLRYAELRTLADDKTSNLWMMYRKELLSMEISRYTSLALVNLDAAIFASSQVNFGQGASVLNTRVRPFTP